MRYNDKVTRFPGMWARSWLRILNITVACGCSSLLRSGALRSAICVFTPFVHWLSKNRIRRVDLRATLKRIFVREGLERKTPNQRAPVYYQYSIQKTYYRPLRHIRCTLQRAGFRTCFQASDHRFRRLVRWTGPIGRWALGIWSNHFHEVTLSTQLPRLP